VTNPHLAHWADIEPRPFERGELRFSRRRVGARIGLARVGLSRYEVPPGGRLMPAHVHADEEEIAFVLAGSGLSWQDSKTYEVRAGDALVHLAGAEAHTLVAGDAGLDVLVFGQGSPIGLTWLPRAQAMWAGRAGRHLLPVGGEHPFDAEVAAGPLALPAPEAERPSTIVSLDDLPRAETRRGRTDVVRADVGRAAGSVATGLKHVVIRPGARSHPAHCHSAQEEVFVVLAGGGRLELGDEEHPLRPGHVVGRPPSTGVAHAFEAGTEGMTMLAYGTRDANDICFYPRSGKVFLRGIGVMGRIERADYWDGED
jgi:uncharacterized cupin superfamily protein